MTARSGDQSVDRLCERDIAFGDAARVVGDEVDPEGAVNVEPLRVVLGPLGEQSDAAHEPEGRHEVRKPKLAVELPVTKRPARQVPKGNLERRVAEPERERHDQAW